VQKKPGDSQFWNGLLKVKDTFLDLGNFQMSNGANIRFWEDKWLWNFTLKQYYPSLYLITHKKHICVQFVFSTIPLNISFRRALIGNNLNSWYNLVARVAHIRLINTEDKILCDLHQTGNFLWNPCTIHWFVTIRCSMTCIYGSSKYLWKLRFSCGICNTLIFIRI
jgi:hypothetical protein